MNEIYCNRRVSIYDVDRTFFVPWFLVFCKLYFSHFSIIAGIAEKYFALSVWINLQNYPDIIPEIRYRCVKFVLKCFVDDVCPRWWKQ